MEEIEHMNEDIEPRAMISGVQCWCRHDETADVVDLIPNPRNPNKHPDKQVALLAKIIRAQGWRQPITVSNRSGFVVKGHGRLEAAKLLGVERVPVERQEYDSEAAEYADLIADNRIAELAEPDEGMLGELLMDTMFADFDMDLTGFEDLSDVGAFDVGEVEPPALPDGDRGPIQQMTFTLHDEQAEAVRAAIDKAKADGYGESAVNENSNGNAIAHICEVFCNG